MTGNAHAERLRGEAMSMLSTQCSKLRNRALVLRQGDWSDGREDALYFVSIIGNEVWLGSRASSDPSGYYVYTGLDLLHAGIDDILAAGLDLSGELMGELAKDP